MHMPFEYRVTIALLTVLYTLGALLPQDRTQTPSQIPSAITLLFGYDTSLSIYANSFASSLNRQLRQEGYSLVLHKAGQTRDEQIATSDVNLYLQSNQSDPGGKVSVTSYPLHTQLTDVSPLLHNSFQALQLDIAYEQNDHRATQVMVDFLTALSLYTVRRCDRAEPYFLRVEANALSLDLETINLISSVRFYRGNCALIAADLPAAAHFYESARGTNAKLSLFTDASAINLAWVYLKLGNTDEAVAIMDQEVARFNPQYSFGFAATALVQRSQIHALAFQYDQAVSDIDQAIDYCMASSSVTPAYCARYYTLRGQTYLLLYQWDNVLADYNKAIELDPTYADAYYYRGVLYYSILQTGQAMYNDALADFQHYLERAPNGEHAADAARYATDIQTQINALNN